MRLKRLCGKTGAGKLQVPESVHNQWVSGDRTELELAMTRALKVHGFDTSNNVRKLLRVWFIFKNWLLQILIFLMFLQFLFLRVLVDKFYSFDLKVHQILVA